MTEINKADKIGMILSIGCAIHCILTPIVLPMLPALGFAISHDSWFHLVLSFVIVLVAGMALIPGYFKHGGVGPIISASIGIVLIILMGVFEHFTQSALTIVPTIIGSTMIALGHYINHSYLCKCKNNGKHLCH